MPTVTLNYDTIVKGLGRSISDKQLKHYITMLGTDLEHLGRQGITVEVFPNRPDMLSDYGFLRALRSFIGVDRGIRQYRAKRSGKRVYVRKSVSKVRPYTACAIVKNLRLNDESIAQIIQLQEKLHISHCRNRSKAAIGLYPSDRIRYPIEFVALKPDQVSFIPLGSDQLMTGFEILRKHKTGREFAHLLAGKSLFPVFRDSRGEILSIPPIINSEFTGKVTRETTEVFIECSGFDISFLSKLLNIIVCELADMGGELYSIDVIYPDRKLVFPDLKPKSMELDESYVEKLLGARVNIKEYLERMGYSYDNGLVSIPCYRTDVLHQIDLVEDIAIAHGYNNFKPELPNITTVANENPIEEFKRKIAELLIGLGFVEVFTFNITNNELQHKLMGLKGNIIEFSNYKSREQSGLRSWMIPSLMEALRLNKNNEYPQFIFDIGYVFRLDSKEETGILEQEMLGLVMAGNQQDYTRVRQVAEYIFSVFGLSAELKPTSHRSFIQGRVAKIKAGECELGMLGEIHPKVLNNFKIEMPVAALQLNITKLFNLVTKKQP